LNGNLCRCTGYRPILYAAKKTYLSQDNPCLEKEKGLTPPCVVRGNDRDYAKTYSNRSLSHPNVKQAVPLESAVLSPAGVSDAPMVLLAKPKMIPLESTVSSPAGASYAPMVLLAKPRIVPLESAVSSPAGASDAPMDMNLGAEVRAVSSKFKSMIMKQSNCLLSEVTRVEWHDTGPKDAVHLKKSEWRHFSSLAHFWNAVINSHPTTSFRIVAGNANHAWNRLDDAADSEAIMFLSLLSIKKLRCISLKDPKKIQIGSAVTLSTLNDEVLKDLCPAAASHLDTVANIQVRNFGTIGGNLAAARIYHKTSDIGLILSALNATIDIEYCIPSQSTSETKITVPIWTFLTTNVDEKCGLLLPPQCVWLITAINLDLSKKTLLSINPYFARVGRRIQNHPSLASVAATATNIIVTEAHCPKEFAKLWKCETSLSPSAKELYEQIKAEDMSTQYFSDGSTLRLIFHLAVQAKLLRSTTLLSKRIKEGQIGSQSFLVDVDASPVTEPIIKPNAYNLRTGSVVYTQDVKIPRNALEATFILSPVARLKFDSKDFGDVGKGIVDDMVGPGVAIFLTAEDASVVADAAKRRSKELGINTKENSLDFLKINGDDSTRKDFDRTQPFGEFIMASGDIGTTFCGQPIAMVLHPELTESRRVARHIQGLVDNWADSSAQQLTESFQKANAVLDLQTSVEKSAELNTRLPSAIVGRGDFLHLLDKEKLSTYLDVKQSVSIDEWIWDWKEYYKDADNYLVIESDTKAPSQSHLYLETQTAMCTEIQNNSFEVHASTQSASSIQDMAANLLGVPNSHVTVKNNIIGGGFGGKEPQSIPVAAAASFACAATGRPVRVMNDRQVDLKMIGKRHAMIGKYRVCIDRRDAKIVAMDLVLNGDAGASKSVSGPVLELAALVSDNAYGIRNFMCRATPYLTNKPTGTAFRSFGVVQTVQLTETAIQHAWDAVHQCGLSGISAPAFRRKHFSNQMPNDKIPCAPLRYNKYSGWTGYGQELRQYKNMGKIWNNIMEKYEEVEEQCNEFNENNRWRKRGVAVLPLRYGISFTFVAGNQGNARVAIFSTDGSVLVDHSGIEMGQGLIARAMVACAAELGVPMHFVRVGPFSTYSTPNAPGTGASTGTALSIPGVVEAAKKLRITLTKLVNAKVDTMLKQSNDCCYLCGAWRKDPTTRAKAVKILNEIGLRTERDNWETSYNGATNPWALYTFLGDSWRIPVPKDEKRDEAKRRIARQNEMWTKFVSGAFDQRKSLISLGYSTPNADGGNELSAQDIFYYFNYATAFSCVEVDCITGEISVLRTDIHYE
jgi:xanthine dehydrogenase molybdopterin-binding subunit B